METISERKKARKQAHRDAEARHGNLGKQRFDHLVETLRYVIRHALEAQEIGSVFGLEGPLRHAIRSDLCLQGWSWGAADMTASDAMDEALLRLRAVRPSYEEGQPGWAISENVILHRTRCVRCLQPLPEGHFKFCGALCTSAHHHSQSRLKEESEVQAIKRIPGRR